MRTTTSRSQRRAVSAVALLAVLLLLSACGGFSTGGDSEVSKDYPTKPVTLTAPAEPGSGWDTTARAFAQAMEKEDLADSPLPVQNRTGATGCVWVQQMANDLKGDAYNIAVTSTPIFSNYLRGDCDVPYTDVTIIASIIVEHYMVVVPSSSEYKDLDGLMAAIKKNPRSVPIAASGDDQLPFALLFKAYGGDPSTINFIQYEGGGEQITAMLNGDVDAAMAGVSEFRGQLESEDLRGLVVVSDDSLDAPLDEIPTAKSLGYDVTLANTRYIMGPADMSEEAVSYWEKKIKEVLDSPTWKDLAERNQWEPLYLLGDDLDSYLKDTDSQIKEGLTETGTIS